MPSFVVEFIDKNGKKSRLIKSTDSKTTLLKELSSSGYLVTNIREIKEQKKYFSINNFFNKSQYLADIFYQISVLLKSGIPLVDALKIAGNNTKKDKIKRMLFDISAKVSEGNTFSSTLKQYNWFVNDIYINIISLSEKVGKLADTLSDIAEYEESNNQSKEKIKSALLYPVTVFSIGIGVIGFLLTFVVPKMEKIFSSINKKLPLSTTILLSISNFLKTKGIYLLILLIFTSIILNFLYKKNKKFKFFIDEKLFKLNFVKKSLLIQFAKNLSFQLREGLPLVDALKNSAITTKNSYLLKHINKIADNVNQGKSFTTSVQETKIFPEIFVATVSTGEKTGNLAELLNKTANYYKKDIEKLSSRFITLIEPLFIAFIGLIVGFIVFSIMLPLFELNTFIK